MFQVSDAKELSKLQELHDQVYDQARAWFHNLKNRFRGQILQHFGPMPEKEADIQVGKLGPPVRRFQSGTSASVSVPLLP